MYYNGVAVSIATPFLYDRNSDEFLSYKKALRDEYAHLAKSKLLLRNSIEHGEGSLIRGRARDGKE